MQQYLLETSFLPRNRKEWFSREVELNRKITELGRGMQAALYWTQQQQLSTLRVATQLGNTAALKRYIASGANIDATAYWLYR